MVYEINEAGSALAQNEKVSRIDSFITFEIHLKKLLTKLFLLRTE